jgi:hypothetical protein
MKKSCRSRLRGRIAPYSTARRTGLKRLLPDTPDTRRAKQEPAKAASMCGHYDQIEFMFLCGFRNHIRRITAQKYAPGFCSGELRFKKKLTLRSARFQCSLAMSIAGRA